jgi:hypothetical protein
MARHIAGVQRAPLVLHMRESSEEGETGIGRAFKVELLYAAKRLAPEVVSQKKMYQRLDKKSADEQLV